MGLMKHSTCDCSKPKVVERVIERVVEKPLPNPNPNNFSIVNLLQLGKNVLAIVQYPDCTNYEGVKVMVYKDTTKDTIQNMSRIDPHFCDNDECLSPFARFEPTPLGIAEARKLAKNLK